MARDRVPAERIVFHEAGHEGRVRQHVERRVLGRARVAVAGPGRLDARACVEINFTAHSFVLNRRVILHAIDAAPAR